MLEHKVFEVVMQYIAQASEKGQKSCFFLMSHLAHKYPAEVMESGVVTIALDKIKTCANPYGVQSGQLIEGACRLLWSVCLHSPTRIQLPTTTPELLLHSLRLVQMESIDAEEHDSSHLVRIDAGAPKDAHKMRAAAALDLLVQDSTVSSWANEKLTQLLDISRKVQPEMLVWLAAQPCIRRKMLAEPSLVKTISDLRHFEWSHDLVVLLIATSSDTNQLAELLEFQHKHQDLTVEDFLLQLFDLDGHETCSRSVVVCVFYCSFALLFCSSFLLPLYSSFPFALCSSSPLLFAPFL